MPERIPAADAGEIGCRLRAFLADGARGGPEIADLIGHLGTLGEVGIFGGMPRDIAWGGADGFRSDVDLVVDASAEALAELMRDAAAVRNRFGGYRVTGARHVYDVWALQTTWAAASGHVAVTNLADLVRTTFFDCDAVVYLCSSGRIHHGGGALAWLRDDRVDLNLEANPNPAGAALRALKLILDRNHAAGPRLTRYLLRMAADPCCGLEPHVASRLQAFARTHLAEAEAAARGRRAVRCRSMQNARERGVLAASPPWAGPSGTDGPATRPTDAGARPAPGPASLGEVPGRHRPSVRTTPHPPR
jgi:hypothetical protein